MSQHRIHEFGAGPASEPCAQLGRTDDFAAANTLELLAYKAAIIAVNGEPPCIHPVSTAAVSPLAAAGSCQRSRKAWMPSSARV